MTDYYPETLQPGSVELGELLRLLWKQFNSLANTQPIESLAGEPILFKNNILTNNILNKSIPKQIYFTPNTSVEIQVKLPSGSIETKYFNTSSSGLININGLKTFCSNNSLIHGSKINLAPFGYSQLEFIYRQKLTQTNDGYNYSWWATEPPGKNYSNFYTDNAKNLLENTVPRLYDANSSTNTYVFVLEYFANYNSTYTTNNNSSNFITLQYFNSGNHDFWTIDTKTGYIIFLGGTQDSSTGINLSKITNLENSDSKSPPFFSFIRYVGDTGFDNVEMSGNIKINGTLDLSNNYTYTDLSDSSYNVLNLKQLEEWYSIKGENQIDISYVLEASLNDYSLDLSVNNIDASGNIKINGTLNLINDLSFLDISNSLDACYNVLNLKQLEEWYYTKGGSSGGSYVLEASLNDYSLDLSVNNIDISGDIKGDNLFLGSNGSTPKINMLFTYDSRPEYITQIEIGNKIDFTSYAPTYITNNAYGMNIKAISDGLFVGIENYDSGSNWRPLLKWGDDISDTPFTIQSHYGNHKWEFSTDGILKIPNVVKGESGTVCKIHIMPFISNDIQGTVKETSTTFESIVFKNLPQDKKLGTNLFGEININYTINGHFDDRYEAYLIFERGTNNIKKGDTFNIHYTNQAGGGSRSSDFNAVAVYASNQDFEGNTDQIKIRLKGRRAHGDDSINFTHGFFKVTELWA